MISIPLKLDIQAIVKKTTYPWKNVWFNNQKYSLELFLKRKVATPKV